MSKYQDHILLLNDVILMRLLNHKVLGKKFAARIISHTLKVDYNCVYANLKIRNDNYKISDISSDYLYNNILHNNMIFIDIIISYTNTDFVACHYVIKMDVLGYSYKKRKLIQIFLDDRDRFYKNEFIYNAYCMEKKHGLACSKLFEKYYINLDYVRKISKEMIVYEKDELIKSLYFLVYYDRILFDNLYKDDDLIKKMINEAKKISLHDFLDLYFVLDLQEIKHLYEEYFINESIKIGIVEEKVTIVKKLYDNGATLDLIRRSTDLSLSDIKKIIEQR